MTNIKTTRAALALTMGILISSLAGAGVDHTGKLAVHNKARIYHPTTYSETTAYKKAAIVTSRKVFDTTDEYKQIAKRKLSPNTAEWCLLAKSASDKFRTALTKATTAGGYDLVAESGAITVDGETLPDITSDVIAQLASE